MSEKEEELPNTTQEAEKFAQEIGSKLWELEAEADLSSIPEEEPLAMPLPDPLAAPKLYRAPLTDEELEPPPSPEQIIEAMLFIGGSPLSSEVACQIVRGLSASEFISLVDSISERYRRQNRPYFVQKVESGYQLTLRPKYRRVKERLSGSPREAKLTQPALDVLSLVAYRQPITRAEIDSLRGSDSQTLLRTLVRLGLIAIVQRAEAGTKEVYYGTTPRFLELFSLKSLDDLPTLGEAEPI